MKKKGIIIGAGILGSAVAYELASRGIQDLAVVDVDMEGSLSSTERNAGGVRHIWQQEINSTLSKLSIELFEKIHEEIGFQKTGYLWLFSKENSAAGEKLLSDSKKRGLAYAKLSTSEVQKEYPFLDKLDDVAFALKGEKDGLINSNALKLYFREQAKEKGCEFFDRRLVTKLTETPKGVSLNLSQFKSKEDALKYLEDPTSTLDPVDTQTATADFVVLCSGAWTSVLLRSMNINPLVKPIRRQICIFKSETFNMNDYGMVVDTSGIYFHPEGGNMLAGLVLKEEKEGFHFNVDPDFFETHIWPALYERSSHMERLKYVTGWGGLYSYTPDQTGILGRVPTFRNVYEAHSFTGRGVMQCYGAALGIADLIEKGKYEKFDASLLSRERFAKGKDFWLTEGLHI